VSSSPPLFIAAPRPAGLLWHRSPRAWGPQPRAALRLALPPRRRPPRARPAVRIAAPRRRAARTAGATVSRRDLCAPRRQARDLLGSRLVLGHPSFAFL